MARKPTTAPKVFTFDKLTVNPDYQKLAPKTSKYDYDALKKSIEERGMQHPIIYDDEGVILSGHNRYEIAKELNLDAGKVPLKHAETVFKDADHKHRFIIEMNFAQRLMDRAKKRELLNKYLAVATELSNRQIAKQTGQTHPTVSTARKEAEATGKINRTTKHRGADGRMRTSTPKRKPRPLTTKPTPPTTPTPMPERSFVVETPPATPTPEAQGNGVGISICPPAHTMGNYNPDADAAKQAALDAIAADESKVELTREPVALMREPPTRQQLIARNNELKGKLTESHRANDEITLMWRETQTKLEAKQTEMQASDAIVKELCAKLEALKDPNAAAQWLIGCYWDDLGKLVILRDLLAQEIEQHEKPDFKTTQPMDAA